MATPIPGSNKRLVIIGSLDGGDEVLALLGDRNMPQGALDLALRTDAEFIGEMTITFAAQGGPGRIHHVEEMRPSISRCADLPLEVPNWKPVPLQGNPVWNEDGQEVEWVGDVTFPVRYDRFDYSDRQILSSLSSRMEKLLEDHPFDPDLDGYGYGGKLDIARDDQGRMKLLTVTLTLDLEYEDEWEM